MSKEGAKLPKIAVPEKTAGGIKSSARTPKSNDSTARGQLSKRKGGPASKRDHGGPASKREGGQLSKRGTGNGSSRTYVALSARKESGKGTSSSASIPATMSETAVAAPAATPIAEAVAAPAAGGEQAPVAPEAPAVPVAPPAAAAAEAEPPVAPSEEPSVSEPMPAADAGVSAPPLAEASAAEAAGAASEPAPTPPSEAVVEEASLPEPSAAEPSAAEPSAAEPSAAEPSAAEPSAAEPSAEAAAAEAGAAEVVPSEIDEIKAQARDAALASLGGLSSMLAELLEVAVFIAFVQHLSAIEMPELQIAAGALNSPKSIEAIWQDNSKREARVAAAAKLTLPKTWRDAIAQATSLANKRELPALTMVSAPGEPLQLRPLNELVEVALVTKVLCKGSVVLPPEAASPWRWPDWWAPILAAGKEAGADFSRGLQKVCATTGKNNALNLRALIGGHRPTALRAIALMLGTVPSLDLRDNMLTAAELTTLGRALTTAEKLHKLTLSGNVLDAAAIATLCDALTLGTSSSLAELDISRIALGGLGAKAEDATVAKIGSLGSAVCLGGKLRSLWAAQNAMSDAAGAAFFTELAKPPDTGDASKGTIQLALLDLSYNQLGRSFAAALKMSMPGIERLTTCNLSHNNLGSDAGAKALTALLSHPSVRTVNVANTNLCDCSPRHKSSTATKWSVKALEALAHALEKSAVTEIVLHRNEICGVWQERVGGEPAMRGSYTTAGVDALIKVLKQSEYPVSLKEKGLKVRA